MKAKDLNEAMNFFLSNSSGTLTCIKNGKEKVVNSYPEAKEFFEQDLKL